MPITSFRSVSTRKNSDCREKSSSRYYSGYYGSQGSGNTMSIKSDYGNITLKKN